MKKLLLTLTLLVSGLSIVATNIGSYAKNRDNPDDPKRVQFYFLIKYKDGTSKTIKNLAWTSTNNVKNVQIYNLGKKPVNKYREEIADNTDFTGTKLKASGLDNYYFYSVYDKDAQKTKYLFTDNQDKAMGR